MFKNEYDSCGIVSVIERDQIPTKENIDECIDALILMNHRAGFVSGEGDGAGIHMDIPRRLWKEKLKSQGFEEKMVEGKDFIVGHFFLDTLEPLDELKEKLNAYLKIVFLSHQETNSSCLGLNGKRQEPYFLQLGLIPIKPIEDINSVLYQLKKEIQENALIHVVSLSHTYVIYKVLGAGDVLRNYYEDLTNPLIASTISLGHNRYSTNTMSNFTRVQPFSVIGHNGEINTIDKLRNEAEMVGMEIGVDYSDSQDLNQVIDHLLSVHHFTLFETMDILFPPIIHEMNDYPTYLKDLYTYLREAWGPYAQGPAAIISRFENEAVFSLDALGLRPLWMLETKDRIFFTSEQGIKLTSDFITEPKPLAPGEKVGLRYEAGKIKVYDYPMYQEEVYKSLSKRLYIKNSHKRLNGFCFKDVTIETSKKPPLHQGLLKASGWNRNHVKTIHKMALTGKEPIGALGYDGPLAALSNTIRNIPDFIQETVAVVTNPAIDREREIEHFSTRVVIGSRPDLFHDDQDFNVIQLKSPIVINGYTTNEQPSLHQVITYFKKQRQFQAINITYSSKESINEVLERLLNETIQCINNGIYCILLEDERVHQDLDHLYIDPHLVLAYLDRELSKLKQRRKVSFILQSSAIRSLHDVVLAIGLGADLVNPYQMFHLVKDELSNNLYQALNHGIEKVISTIGIHELRGYSRLFSSIGLNEDIIRILQITNFYGSIDTKYNLAYMKEEALKRVEIYQGNQTLDGVYHLYPKISRSINQVANKEIDYASYRDLLGKLEESNPIAIRHLLSFKNRNEGIDKSDVSIGIKDHDYPFIISSMSFGSQNEIPYRAYAEAAHQLNMISFTGEGGEIKDMMGKYPNTRGQQIASGRFGVNSELLNSSNLIEIKIGQGAKPGEGGHLPGAKVTDKIALARNATTGCLLISPSNNHDIYSIEDLAQIISEIKTANDQAKVSVKVPVVPNIGTISVGIAKAGADFINLSGYDGGTGAARLHAIAHVGLPIEIGVKLVHEALVSSGLRKNIEIWADGGIRSAEDVLKIMLLGANRIGFGTLAMIAVGCTTCKQCNLGTCHVGITTQIDSLEEALSQSVKHFKPRQYEASVINIKNLMFTLGEALKSLTAELGYTNLQEIVGRSDLLLQETKTDLLDLKTLVDCVKPQEIMDSKHEEVQANTLDFNTSALLDSRDFNKVNAKERNLVSRVSCHQTRNHTNHEIKLKYMDSIVGNGFGSYHQEHIHAFVQGGAQDGVAKTAYGGTIGIFKSIGADGQYYNGSVGKGFGYGASKGLLMVQGNADARAGIRLSGATLLIGGRIKKPIVDHIYKGIHANIKGFAFEYMTNGCGVVLGDPGPWICSGMTGGILYLHVDIKNGLTEAVLKTRIAKGAKVIMQKISEPKQLESILKTYWENLVSFHQDEEALYIKELIRDIKKHFVEIVPIPNQDES